MMTLADVVSMEPWVYGIAMLSRGNMTAPRAAMVYRKGKEDWSFQYIVHTVNLETGARSHGSYHDNIIDALDTFRDRVEMDHLHFVNNGIPLTGEWVR